VTSSPQYHGNISSLLLFRLRWHTRSPISSCRLVCGLFNSTCVDWKAPTAFIRILDLRGISSPVGARQVSPASLDAKGAMGPTVDVMAWA
jgi:hypothetical protein